MPPRAQLWAVSDDAAIRFQEQIDELGQKNFF